MNNYHKILIDCDEKDHWEFPPESTSGINDNELQNIKSSLDKIFGLILNFDNYVQDASFSADIGELDERYYDRNSGTGALVYKFAFRFSNFGRLYTITGNKKYIPELSRKIEKAKNLLKQENFIFIPKEALHFEYDGINKPFEKGLTWWTRYFDYL